MTYSQRNELIIFPGERLICRRRAALLRKRGVFIRWAGWTDAGASVYAWFPHKA